MRMAEPGTIPPPVTRSNSPIPLGRRGAGAEERQGCAQGVGGFVPAVPGDERRCRKIEHWHSARHRQHGAAHAKHQFLDARIVESGHDQVGKARGGSGGFHPAVVLNGDIEGHVLRGQPGIELACKGLVGLARLVDCGSGNGGTAERLPRRHLRERSRDHEGNVPSGLAGQRQRGFNAVVQGFGLFDGAKNGAHRDPPVLQWKKPAPAAARLR